MKGDRATRFARGAWISLALAGAVLFGVWWPELAHWYVRPQPLGDTVLRALQSAPAAAELTELAGLQLRGVAVAAPDAAGAAASVMRGELTLPTFPTMRVGPSFDPDDLTRGSPAWQLMAASMVVADVLLDGYLVTGQVAMLQRARAYLDGFARFEDTRWVDHGLMWNDHAISARVPVLIKLWAIERQRHDGDPDAQRRLLKLAARSALLLAKPSAYAWRSSHGILTDLALLQLAAAFPSLPEADLARRTAADRFSRHLPYWINTEGVTLLHSAGYHAGSLYHLSMGLRLFTLNGLPISPDWWSRFDKAVAHLAQLQRPDGTLPMYGDTNSAAQTETPTLTARAAGTALALPLAPRRLPATEPGLTLYPVAGLAAHRHTPTPSDTAGSPPQPDSQTVLTWGYHPGLGHKLADELSLLLWAGGQTWLTNTGYWPYGVAGRLEAESWRAANGPHLQGEPANAARRSDLLSSASSSAGVFLDAQRTSASGYTVRRQVLYIAPENTWLVLDASTDTAARRQETLWQFYPGLTLRAGDRDGRQFDLRATAASSVMRVLVAANPGAEVSAIEGQRAPFGGWVVLDRVPTPAPALAVTQPSQAAVSATSFSLAPAADSAQALPTALHVVRWNNASDWTLRLTWPRRSLEVRRDPLGLTIANSRSLPLTMTPQNAPDSAHGRQAIQDAFQSATAGEEHFPERYPFRVRVSLGIAAALALQELFLRSVAWRAQQIAWRLRQLSWPIWCVGGFWLARFYLA